MTEDPKILDYGGVSVMRYYKDPINGSYFYLEEFGRKVYDDKIVESPRDSSVKTISSYLSSSGSLYVELKTYLDELIMKPRENN